MVKRLRGPRSAVRRVLHGSAIAASVTVLALAAPTAAVATPVSAAATSAKTISAPVLKYAISVDIDTLNPFTTILASGQQLMRLEYESLVQFSAEDNSVVPGMASQWSTSADGTVWTFTLPKGRTWSDGKPVTAKDPAFTYTAVLENPELQQAHGGDVGSIVSAVAKDNETLVITLREPQASNPGALIPIVPEHIWSGISNKAGYANDKDVVGSGPFVVKSYAHGQAVQLVANDRFWRGAPKIGGISYVYYKNSDAQVQALRAGEVDLVSGLTPAQFDSLKGVSTVSLNQGVSRRHSSMAINPGAKDATGAPLGNGNPALQDVTLRRSIAMAIDRKTLLEKVLLGYGTLGQTELPPVYPAYYGISQEDVIPFDPAAANAALDTAGYRKGSDGIRLDTTGKPLQLRLLGRSTDATHAQMAEYIKPWLANIGIAVNYTSASSNQVNDDSTLGKYDMYFTGWGVDPDPDSQLALNLCSARPNADGSGATSENNWCDPEFDALYAKQHTELDAEKRAELVKQAAALLYANAPNTVLWYQDLLEAYRSDRFSGFTLQPAKDGAITGQAGYWGFYGATPVGTTAAGGDSAPNGLLIGGILVAVVVVVGGIIAFVVVRRRRTADERE